MARTVFTGANLIDGLHPARPAQTVVVDGNRIAEVGDDGRVATRPDDRVVALAGRTLMPGMVQCHFHSHFGAFGDGVTAPALGLEAAPPYLSMLAAVNAKTSLDCGFTSAIGSSNAFAIDVSLKEAILMGLIPGPRYLAGSREIVVTGEASDYPNNRNFFMELGCTGLTRAANGADGWRFAAREEVGRGVDVLKIAAGPGHGSSPAVDYMYPSREELRAAVDEVHKRGRKTRAHAPSRTSILECALAGVDIIDHADMLDQECIDAILDAGSVVVPSMLWSKRFLELAESWDHDAQVLPISEGFRETPAQVRARIAAVRRDYEYTREAIPAAAAAGVPMVVGDDFGTPLLPHGDYAAELVLYVKELGVDPLDVIRWATVNGARAMGMGDELGVVAAGRLADLVVVDGDPLADIAVLGDRARILAVLKDGVFERDALGAASAR
ncbi:MAG: amidohydrolase family protein [Myxococcota bacterium]|nr:amidohydrolase family protein [Myxococcales bacterium]